MPYMMLLEDDVAIDVAEQYRNLTCFAPKLLENLGMTEVSVATHLLRRHVKGRTAVDAKLRFEILAAHLNKTTSGGSFNPVDVKRYCSVLQDGSADESHDELKDRRKTCIDCGVPYGSKRAWGDCKKGFIQRLEKTEVDSVPVPEGMCEEYVKEESQS